MSLLRTAFDIDGVMCHTWKTMLTLLNKEGYEVGEDDLTKFRLEDCLDVPEEVIRKVVTDVLTENYMSTIPVDEEAVEGVRALNKLTGKTIPFITSRKDRDSTIYYLENYIVKDDFPYVVECGSWDDGLSAETRKLIQMRQLGCVVMVEDAPETLQLLSLHHIVPVLVDRPYNKYCTWALRLTDWGPLLNLVCKLEGVM